MEEPQMKKQKTGDGNVEEATRDVPAQQVKEFLDGLKFTQPLSVLEEKGVVERLPCPKCSKRKQYYCYDCLEATTERARPRDVKLPVKVHVLLHHGEHRGKATSVQAAILSKDVALYVHPQLPKGTKPEETLLVYPSKDAKTLEELQAEGRLDSVKNLVFIDSTWQQSKSICKDKDVLAIGQPIQLNEYRTLFWRFQNTGDDRFLATIEAIYYLLKDFHIARGLPYSGQYDDLLYYYVHQYAVIQRNYRSVNRSFTRRHQKAESYIREIDFSYLLKPPPGSEPAEGGEGASAEDAQKNTESTAEA